MGYHIDAKNAFLDENFRSRSGIHDTIRKVNVLGKENKSFNLRKTVYGVKKAIRAWTNKKGESLKMLNFGKRPAILCIFVQSEGESSIYMCT